MKPWFIHVGSHFSMFFAGSENMWSIIKRCSAALYTLYIVWLSLRHKHLLCTSVRPLQLFLRFVPFFCPVKWVLHQCIMSFSAKIVKAQYRNTFDLRWHVLDKAAQIPYSRTYEELTATLDWNCGGLTTHCVMVRRSYNQVFNVTRSQHDCSPIEHLWYFLVHSRTMMILPETSASLCVSNSSVTEIQIN